MASQCPAFVGRSHKDWNRQARIFRMCVVITISAVPYNNLEDTPEMYMIYCYVRADRAAVAAAAMAAPLFENLTSASERLPHTSGLKVELIK